MSMEFRQLGYSGLQVPIISFGTGTFGGSNDFFKAWGSSDVAEATRLVDICLEAGVNLFDTADIYSYGPPKRSSARPSKAAVTRSSSQPKRPLPWTAIPTMSAPRATTSSSPAKQACAASAPTTSTSIICMASTRSLPSKKCSMPLDTLVRSGKVRYIACSNFSGWHLMKALSVSERYGWARYVGHQVYYSLASREYEWELMPLALDQKVGALVWSPLGWGRLTGKIRRGHPLPAESRLHVTAEQGPPIPDEHLYNIVDALDEIAKETEKSVPQVALNWLFQRPTVSTVIIGARNEEQLRQNLAAAGWKLTAEQVAKLDKASEVTKTYPYWHQAQFANRNPLPV